MATLKIKLKTVNRLGIKKRNLQIRKVILKAIEDNPSLIGKKPIDSILVSYSFMLEPNKNYTSDEPFRIGTLFVNRPNSFISELVLKEMVRWVSDDEKMDLEGAAPGSIKSKLFTQLNYERKILDVELKRKINTLHIFNRFKYLDTEGRVIRCLKNA